MPEFWVAKRGARIVIIVGEAVLNILLAIGFAAGWELRVFFGDPDRIAIGDSQTLDSVVVAGAGVKRQTDPSHDDDLAHDLYLYDCLAKPYPALWVPQTGQWLKSLILQKKKPGPIARAIIAAGRR
jgi:hypothetical protein